MKKKHLRIFSSTRWWFRRRIALTVQSNWADSGTYLVLFPSIGFRIEICRDNWIEKVELSPAQFFFLRIKQVTPSSTYKCANEGRLRAPSAMYRIWLSARDSVCSSESEGTIPLVTAWIRFVLRNLSTTTRHGYSNCPSEECLWVAEF